MKRQMVVVAVALASVMSIAAQCEGKTQKSERCKREAAEGAKYCIGHADQAKKDVKTETKGKAAPKQKLEQKTNAEQKASAEQKSNTEQNADDICWAVTEAGTRCKHKRDGESDYCKQHSPNVKPAKPVEQCRAMTNEGKQCSRKPEDGKRYCKQHGGNRCNPAKEAT